MNTLYCIAYIKYAMGLLCFSMFFLSYWIFINLIHFYFSFYYICVITDCLCVSSGNTYIIQFQLARSGCCIKGMIAEDSTLATQCHLYESSTGDWAESTEVNARDSDATLVLVDHLPVNTPGTQATIEFAKKHGRPHLAVGLLVDGDSLAQGTYCWLLGYCSYSYSSQFSPTVHSGI